MNPKQHGKFLMRKIAFLVSGAALLAAANAALADGVPAREVTGTVDLSEWAEPGELTVNLDTGAFSFKPGVWTSSTAKGKLNGEPMAGVLDRGALRTLEKLVARAETDGLLDAQCAATEPAKRGVLIISTGGTPSLEVSTSAGRLRSHDDLACWTDAANALRSKLQAVLDDARAD
jgi:hypothetical protein